jgi:hypothetical protein
LLEIASVLENTRNADELLRTLSCIVSLGRYIEFARAFPRKRRSYLYSMRQTQFRIRTRQILIGLIGVAVISLFIIPPLLAPQYEVKQGTFQAHILTSAAGMGMAARPILRARIEDETGRIFWLQLPSTHISAAGTPLIIDVWCETDAHKSCTARYRPSEAEVR